MKEKNEEKSNIFSRISQLVHYKGYNSLRDLAVNGLGYTGSEKLNRLKKDGASPSIDIILDISNKFSDISLDWLLIGEGNMLKNFPEVTAIASEPHAPTYGQPIIEDLEKKLLIESINKMTDTADRNSKTLEKIVDYLITNGTNISDLNDSIKKKYPKGL